jgi:hypothetical protein
VGAASSVRAVAAPEHRWRAGALDHRGRYRGLWVRDRAKKLFSEDGTRPCGSAGKRPRPPGGTPVRLALTVHRIQPDRRCGSCQGRMRQSPSEICEQWSRRACRSAAVPPTRSRDSVRDRLANQIRAINSPEAPRGPRQWMARLEPGETKSGKGRQFPLISELRAVPERQLAITRELEVARGMVIPWLFHLNGRRIRNFRRAWLTACEKAGVPGKIPHDFRRTAVRNLERAGVPRSAAMAMVGHATQSIYSRYAIADESMLRDGAGRLAALHQHEATWARDVRWEARLAPPIPPRVPRLPVAEYSCGTRRANDVPRQHGRGGTTERRSGLTS